jgi:arylsulfatase A-like enzyme
MATKLSRRQFGKVIASAVSVSTVGEKASFSHQSDILRRPHIVFFICSDEHNGQMLMGGPGEATPARTPHLARLASKGAWFRNAYTVDPVSAVGRAAMMTGRFASDIGSYGNATPFDGRVPTWGDSLRDVGYYCWATGKMDLTPEAEIGFKQFNTSHGHFKNPDIKSIWRWPLCYRVDQGAWANGGVGEGNRRRDLDVTETGGNSKRFG